jgi:hypothetical protein
MPIQTIELLNDGQVEWSPKGIGMTVKHRAHDEHGGVVPEGTIVERVTRAGQLQPPLKVQFVNGEWGDYHVIPHQADAGNALRVDGGLVSDQIWVHNDATVQASGFRIVKTATLQDGIYHVTITKQPLAVTVDGTAALQGQGQLVVTNFQMRWQNGTWSRVQ